MLHPLPSHRRTQPVDAALLQAPSATLPDAVDLTKADEAALTKAPRSLAAAPASTHAELTQHLCFRAANLVASIELSDSAADIPGSRESRSGGKVGFCDGASLFSSPAVGQSHRLRHLISAVKDSLPPELRAIMPLGSTLAALMLASDPAPGGVAAGASARLHAVPAQGGALAAPSGETFGDSLGHRVSAYVAGVYSAFLRASWPTAWMSPSLFLSLRRGGIAEHAAILQVWRVMG